MTFVAVWASAFTGSAMGVAVGLWIGVRLVMPTFKMLLEDES